MVTVCATRAMTNGTQPSTVRSKDRIALSVETPMFDSISRSTRSAAAAAPETRLPSPTPASTWPNQTADPSTNPKEPADVVGIVADTVDVLPTPSHDGRARGRHDRARRSMDGRTATRARALVPVPDATRTASSSSSTRRGCSANPLTTSQLR